MEDRRDHALSDSESAPRDNIPRVSRLSPQVFVDEYYKKGKPVIITDALEDWPALKWTLASLQDRVGANEVAVRSNTNTAEYRVGTKYKIVKMPFRDYAEMVENHPVKALNFYMAVQNIKHAFPQLDTECPMPPYIQKLHRGPFMWIAPPGHFEFTHVDPDDNLLTMIRGRKRIRLFNPRLFELMYPNPLGSLGFTLQSQVDVSNPDYEKFPQFRMAMEHMEECILSAGEMLFFPAFYWHQVTSIDTCISINCFFGDAGSTAFIEKLTREPFWPSFRYWLLNIVEQNRQVDKFAPLLPVLDKVIENFIYSRHHEQVSPDVQQQLRQSILEYCGYKADDTFPLSGAERNHPVLKVRGLLFRDA